MIVEVCANSYESALNAEKAGADRIELCSELAVGGITPSHGLLQKATKELSIPIHVLIRPRAGDFTFSEAEFDIMKRDIEYCKELGCNGIVSGVLYDNNTIDIERTRELVELTKPLSFTFHRAFDWVGNPLQAITQLTAIDVHRILTSGQESSAEKGLETLKKMKAIAGEKMIILPGGGINLTNILQFKNAEFKEIHFSATKLVKTIDMPKVPMNSHRFFDETQLVISDVSKIEQLIALVK